MEFSFNAPDDLVTIAACESQPEFIVVRSLLQSADIECYSPDSTDYYVKGKGSTVTSIQVQVRASQADDAIALLKNAEAHPIAGDGDTDPQP